MILLLAVLPFFYFCKAQSYGVQAGVNFASQSIGSNESGGFTISTSSKAGFLIGAVAEFPLAKSLNFRPELNYIQKGSKTTGETADESVLIALNYLELPLNMIYHANAGKGRVCFGAGPVLGYGLSGYTRIRSGGEELTTDIKFDGRPADDAADGYGHLKALDIGLNFFTGYQLSNGLFANAGYAFGLSNITPQAGSTLRNKGFFIKLGYSFESGKSKTGK